MQDCWPVGNWTGHWGWELPMEEKAAYYVATQSIYLAVQKDYGDDRTKKHGDNNNFRGKAGQ